MAATQEQEKGKEKGGTEVGTVYQATLGHWHMGVWTTAEEAEDEIKAFKPDATPFQGLPTNIGEVPEGQYYIQPRTLFTKDQARAGELKGKLGKTGK